MTARVAIFGGGRVGTAMALEMPGVPVVRRGQDAGLGPGDVACVCWPAQAVAGFAASHPRAATARRVAFCNGVWAVGDGMDEHGCCYVRAVHLGDRAKPGRNGWRVASAGVAAVLRGAGLGVTHSSRSDHAGHLWGKALYLLPVALACADLGGLTGRAVTDKVEYAEWYDAVRSAAVVAIGEAAVVRQEPHVRHLVGRTPRGWAPSPLPEELAYFRARLQAG